MTEIERLIVAKLKSGPKYAKSFHHAKPVVQRLVDRGVIVRVAPPGLKTRNMLALKAREADRG